MNKIVIYITIIAVVLFITIPTVKKIIDNDHNNLYTVVEKRIEESARKCIYEGKCKTNKITLQDLYDYKYIDEEVYDPVTKIVYANTSYIIINKEGAIFYPEY